MIADSENEFLTVLKWAAVEAIGSRGRSGRELTLVLKGGEELSGIPESARGNAEHVALRDVPHDEAHHYGPFEFTIQIAGTDVLAQEVERFTLGPLNVALPRPLDG
jgi:hypothetical protein